MSKELEAKIIELIDDYLKHGLNIDLSISNELEVRQSANLDSILREYGLQLAEIAKNI
jgi:hypothetical protein